MISAAELGRTDRNEARTIPKISRAGIFSLLPRDGRQSPRAELRRMHAKRVRYPSLAGSTTKIRQFCQKVSQENEKGHSARAKAWPSDGFADDVALAGREKMHNRSAGGPERYRFGGRGGGVHEIQPRPARGCFGGLERVDEFGIFAQFFNVSERFLFDRR